MEVTKTLYGLTQEILLRLQETDLENELELSKLESEVLVKVDNLAGYLNYLDDQIELVSAKERKIKELKNALKARSERLESYCIKVLEHSKKTSVIGHNKEIKLRTNPMSVEIEDADKIPAEFVDLKQELVINKKKILDHVKESGELVAGVNIKRTKSITIKEVLK